MTEILEKLRKDLEANVDPKTKETGQRFFKEKIKIYGMKTAVVSKIAKDYFKQIQNYSEAEIFDLCEQLWKSGYMEESFIACEWTYSLKGNFEPNDFTTFERWIEKYVSNWASCDTLCNHTIGAFLEKYPAFIENLKKWAKSENRWMRRASAVSFIIPARKGLFQKDILEIADILLLDKDDLVQKGYGWMLKAASQFDQDLIFQYVMKNKAVMPRTALRYAIEKMPKELKEKAMAK